MSQRGGPQDKGRVVISHGRAVGIGLIVAVAVVLIAAGVSVIAVSASDRTAGTGALVSGIVVLLLGLIQLALLGVLFVRDRRRRRMAPSPSTTPNRFRR